MFQNNVTDRSYMVYLGIENDNGGGIMEREKQCSACGALIHDDERYTVTTSVNPHTHARTITYQHPEVNGECVIEFIVSTDRPGKIRGGWNGRR